MVCRKEGQMGMSVPDAWAVGEPYERFMGRWSRAIAEAFLVWLNAPAGQIWGDIGCGTGALSASIIATTNPVAVVAVDRSAGFLSAARGLVRDGRVTFAVADATALPWRSGTCATTVAGLALNFVADPPTAVREMARVTGRAGKVAAYVWDYQHGMEMLRHFWDAVVAIDPAAAILDEGRRFPLCQPAPLAALFEEARLKMVDVREMVIPMVFRTFDEYWDPFLGRQGPAPAYVASLSETARDHLRTALMTRLASRGGGPIMLTARAWAVQGTV
jgi:SAM-dependent methyltransferase